jgi:Mn2+/Fe2+ NRAMP family transporter
LLYPTLAAAIFGNTLEAGADLGGIAAGLNLLTPLPAAVIVVATAAAILAIQVWGSYELIRNIMRILALALLAYVPAAILARPHWGAVMRASVVPAIHFNRESLSMLVAIVGTTMSAYLYTWQSNEEVEEEKKMGRTRLGQRKGATNRELSRARHGVLVGMFFSNLAMYAIILATASTLFGKGKADISAAEAAQALRPVAGSAAGTLFALGVIGVGFLAVPVMTTGAAYDLCQARGWKSGLNERPSGAPQFYIATAVFTALALSVNFFGFNPMKILVVAGIVQGFSTPPLMLLILLMTNNRRIMGDRVNGRLINILGGVTVVAMFAATLALIWTWIR